MVQAQLPLELGKNDLVFSRHPPGQPVTEGLAKATDMSLLRSGTAVRGGGGKLGLSSIEQMPTPTHQGFCGLEGWMDENIFSSKSTGDHRV